MDAEQKPALHSTVSAWAGLARSQSTLYKLINCSFMRVCVCMCMGVCVICRCERQTGNDLCSWHPLLVWTLVKSGSFLRLVVGTQPIVVFVVVVAVIVVAAGSSTLAQVGGQQVNKLNVDAAFCWRCCHLLLSIGPLSFWLSLLLKGFANRRPCHSSLAESVSLDIALPLLSPAPVAATQHASNYCISNFESFVHCCLVSTCRQPFSLPGHGSFHIIDSSLCLPFQAVGPNDHRDFPADRWKCISTNLTPSYKRS